MIQIKITYSDEQIKTIEITGHANSNEYGKDLVCAGVSSISVGALNAIDSICPDSCNLIMDEGFIKIEVTNNNENLQLILNVLKIQLETMEFSQNKYMKIMKDEV